MLIFYLYLIGCLITILYLVFEAYRTDEIRNTGENMLLICIWPIPLVGFLTLSIISMLTLPIVIGQYLGSRKEYKKNKIGFWNLFKEQLDQIWW